MPIKIDFISNVTAFLRGTKDTEDALDDVADALDDVVRDGKTGGDKLERSFKDIADAAKDADKQTDKLGDGAKKGFGKAADAGREFKDETLSNVSEITSSFDGSVESAGELIQGTLGGLTQGLGPALGGAAAAAAAGVGVITQAFVTAGEAADEARDSAFAFAYDVAGALEQAGYSERVREWTGDTEKLKQAQDIAKIAGMDVADVIDGLASGGAKLDGVWEAFEQGASSTDVASGRALELEAALKGTREGYLNGADAAKIAAGLNYDYATSVGKATGETDDLGNAIYKLPDGKEVVVDARTERAYEDLDALDRKKPLNKEVVVTVRADTGEAERKIKAITDAAGRTVYMNVSAKGSVKWE